MNRQERIKLFSKTRRRRGNPEARIQKAIVDHFRILPANGAWCIHIPNQGRRTKEEHAELKLMGMLPGAADLLVIVPGKCPLWLELKSKGEKPRVEQLAFADLVCQSGHVYRYADSIGDALAILRAHGALKPDIGYRRQAA